MRRALSAQTYYLEEFLAPTVKRSHKLLNLESDHSESNNTTIEDKQNITFELAYEINWINYSCLKVKSMVWQLSLRLQRLVPNLKMSGLLRTIEVEKFFLTPLTEPIHWNAQVKIASLSLSIDWEIWVQFVGRSVALRQWTAARS